MSARTVHMCAFALSLLCTACFAACGFGVSDLSPLSARGGLVHLVCHALGHVHRPEGQVEVPGRVAPSVMQPQHFGSVWSLLNCDQTALHDYTGMSESANGLMLLKN